jgi:hypothetical protein
MVHTNTFEDGGHDWNDLVLPTLIGKSKQDITDSLRLCCIRDLFNGHAYSPSEIEQIRDWAKISPDKFDDEALTETLDVFAFYVGWKTVRGVDQTAAERIKKINRELIQPISKIKRCLNEKNVALEFMQDEQDLSSGCLTKLHDAFDQCLAEASAHIKVIEETKANGRRSLAREKIFHVQTVEILLDYLDSFRLPKRTNLEECAAFLTLVRLLAAPLFKKPDAAKSKEKKPQTDGFTTIVRNFVDSWNREHANLIDLGMGYFSDVEKIALKNRN